MKEEVKKTMEEWVESYLEMLPEAPNCPVVTLKSGKEIRLLVHLDRSQSTWGDYEPPWEPNTEGIKMCADELGIETYEELEEAIEYAKSLVPIRHKTNVPRDAFGGIVEVATLDDCSEEEFDKATDLLAPYVWGYGNKGGPTELPETIVEGEEALCNG